MIRTFFWEIGYRYPRVPSVTDLTVRGYRSVLTYITVRVPPGAVVTQALLDTAIIDQVVEVWTIAGNLDPLTNGDVDFIEPSNRSVYFDHGHLHLVITGHATVGFFDALQPDSVQLRWCVPPNQTIVRSVPLLHALPSAARKPEEPWCHRPDTRGGRHAAPPWF